MTEAEWLTSTDAERMVRFLQFGAAGRLGAGLARLAGRRHAARDAKLQAFVRLCVVRVGRPHEFEHSRLVRGTTKPAFVVRWSCQAARERAEAANRCDERVETVPARTYTPPGSGDPIDAPMSAELRRRWRVLAAVRDEAALQCAHLRDLFGNPFRPITFAAGWRTDTAVTLARTMEELDEFGAMPILADALQDAGCDHPDILDHCRGKGPHVRGCWVCDLVLGKE